MYDLLDERIGEKVLDFGGYSAELPSVEEGGQLGVDPIAELVA
ncbi:hypothetical protein [Mycolicibacterium poriferae]|nr:hypothetical protein [Mycolicibacterium poriferae]